MKKCHPDIFIIEGLPRLGKTTLIENIHDRLGSYVEISGVARAPKSYLEGFENGTLNLPDGDIDLGANTHQKAGALYQYQDLLSSFAMMDSNAKIIFDGLHLTTSVYAPRILNVEMHSPMALEKFTFGDELIQGRTRLILLTEDFDISSHSIEFPEDAVEEDTRPEIQQKYIEWFNKSTIRDKRAIPVTNKCGKFRDARDILMDALG